MSIFHDNNYMFYLTTRNFSSKPEDQLPEELIHLVFSLTQYLGQEKFAMLTNQVKELKKQRKQMTTEQLNKLKQYENSKYQQINQLVINYVSQKRDQLPGANKQQIQQILDFEHEFTSMTNLNDESVKQQLNLEFPSVLIESTTQPEVSLSQNNIPQVPVPQLFPIKQSPSQVGQVAQQTEMQILQNQINQLQQQNKQLNNQLEQVQTQNDNAQVAYYKQNIQTQTDSIKQLQDQISKQQQENSLLKKDMERERQASQLNCQQLQNVNRQLQNYQQFACQISRQLTKYEGSTNVVQTFQDENGQLQLDKIFEKLLIVLKTKNLRLTFLQQLSVELGKLKQEFNYLKNNFVNQAVSELNKNFEQVIQQIGQKFQYCFMRQQISSQESQYKRSFVQQQKQQLLQNSDNLYLQLYNFDTNFGKEQVIKYFHDSSFKINNNMLRCVFDRHAELQLIGAKMKTTLQTYEKLIGKKQSLLQVLDFSNFNAQNAFVLLKNLNFSVISQYAQSQNILVSSFVQFNGENGNQLFHDGIKHQMPLLADLSNQIKISIINDSEYQRMLNLLSKKVLHLKENEQEQNFVKFNIDIQVFDEALTEVRFQLNYQLFNSVDFCFSNNSNQVSSVIENQIQFNQQQFQGVAQNLFVFI